MTATSANTPRLTGRPANQTRVASGDPTPGRDTATTPPKGNDMGFLKDRLAAAADAARRGDGEQCDRILEHAVAEDPTAFDQFRRALAKPDTPRS